MLEPPAEHRCTAVLLPTHVAVAPWHRRRAHTHAVASEGASTARIVLAERRERLGVRRDSAADKAAASSLFRRRHDSVRADLL